MAIFDFTLSFSILTHSISFRVILNKVERMRFILYIIYMGKRIFGFNRNVFFLGLVSFFNDISNQMVQSVMPVFLTTVLGASAFFVGVLEGVADALASVLKVFSGWFSDKIHKRKAPAVLGYALSLGVRPLLALVTHFSQVFSLRVIDRIGKGIRDAPRDALISESIEPHEYGKSFGIQRAFDALGTMVGPLVAFLLLPILMYSYQSLFLVAFVVGLGTLVSFVFVRDSRARAPEIHVPPPKLNAKLFKTNKRFILITGSIFVFGMGTLPIILLLLKAAEVGLPGESIPLVYFVYNLAFVLGAVPLGKLADRIGEGKVIAGGFIAAIIAYLGLAGTRDIVLTILLFALLGVYSAATDGVERALAAKHLSPDVLASGQGFLNMAIGFSSLVAGVVGGFLWTRFGSTAALDYAGIISLVGLLVFIHVDRNVLKESV